MFRCQGTLGVVCLTSFTIALYAQQTAYREENAIEYQPLPFRQFLDVTIPSGTGPFPAVVVLHGGGFIGGTRADVRNVCGDLAAAGIAAAAVDYRPIPQQLFPAPLNDVKSAIRWMRANARRLNIDPDRIGALGIDSGGYLAMFAALTGTVSGFEGIGSHQEQSSRIAAAVAVRPVLDPREMEVDVRSSFLGGDPAKPSTKSSRANLLSWVTPDAAPILLLADKGVGVERFVERMREVGASLIVSAPEANPKTAIAFLQQRLAVAPQTRIVVADHGPGSEVVLIDWPSGKEVWSAPNNRGHDAQILPNGNVLATLEEDGAVLEYDPKLPPDANVVWEYGHMQGLKLTIAAERLPNGNTLIADTGVGRVFEIGRDEKIVWEYKNADLAGNRMRNCNRTPASTTLISIEAASTIIEVDRAGKIVWSWKPATSAPRRPYRAKRLANGNTLISLMGPGELVEVAPSGEIVRSVGGNGPLRMGWTSGFDLLPNGNLIIGDYTGQRLIEVDSSGNVVHELLMRHRPATVAVAPRL